VTRNIRPVQQYVIAGSTIAASAFGARIGYGAGGIGGAVVFIPLLGIGGLLFGLLAIRTASLASAVWPIVLAVAVIIIVGLLSWGVYL
jgi:hypothetical protein